MISRMNSSGLMLVAMLVSGLALAQQPAAPPTTGAKLTEVTGGVLVSQADAMAAAANDQRLAPGARIITTAGAKAAVVYDKGCTIRVEQNQRYTVRERAECTPAEPPPLGKAAEFAVLGGSAVKNIGETVVDGEVGVHPGTGVTGFPPGKVNNAQIHPADDLAEQAQKDAVTAYDDLVKKVCNVSLAGQNLGGLTLTPGVYCFPSAPARLTGELTLDAQGDPNAVFVFQVGTTLTTDARSWVRVKGDSEEGEDKNPPADDKDKKKSKLCHVYWQVPGTAKLGADSYFLGNIVGIGGIDIANKAEMVGRALARTGQVTLDTDKINRVSCVPILAWWVPPAVIGAGIIAIGIPNENPQQPLSPN